MPNTNEAAQKEKIHEGAWAVNGNTVYSINIIQSHSEGDGTDHYTYRYRDRETERE